MNVKGLERWHTFDNHVSIFARLVSPQPEFSVFASFVVGKGLLFYNSFHVRIVNQTPKE